MVASHLIRPFAAEVSGAVSGRGSALCMNGCAATPSHRINRMLRGILYTSTRVVILTSNQVLKWEQRLRIVAELSMQDMRMHVV